MKLALIGVGDAGTRIVDRLVAAEAETGRWFTEGNVLAFNTAAHAFDETESIPDERQVLIGDTHPAVTQRVPDDTDGTDSTAAGRDEADVSGAAGGSTAERPGVGGDPEVGADVATTDLPEIRRALDQIDETEVAATMVVAGLGGGTGSGVGSVIVEELQAVHESPVYALGVLPASTESDRRALTAARGIRTLVPLADAVFPVDNEAWRHGEDPVSDRYDAINDAIATRIVGLFGAGERDPTSPSEMRIDPADIRRTLDVGGIASIGRETVTIDTDSSGWIDRLLRLLGLADDTRGGHETDAATVKRLVQQALNSALTLPCDIGSTDRALLILSGPPSAISRKGFETGRYLLEEETGTVEVLAGDEPLPDAETITATVLFANVTSVPRIEELQARATEAAAFDPSSEDAAGAGDADAIDASSEDTAGASDADAADAPVTDTDGGTADVDPVATDTGEPDGRQPDGDDRDATTRDHDFEFTDDATDDDAGS
ncbi:tubulin/FtsZ family protein [Halorubrum sp. BV1]|uniref:tubulin/FtsZ family protein n=1 Tax=Halorubrum sp. BV1 TaxID=1498500 RepID=UPI000678B180|nr:tubulin/FtsZ family protein [Halorubrum sp. BV1]